MIKFRDKTTKNVVSPTTIDESICKKYKVNRILDEYYMMWHNVIVYLISYYHYPLGSTELRSKVEYWNAPNGKLIEILDYLETYFDSEE